jgi:cytochrome c oxidase subunit IV
MSATEEHVDVVEHGDPTGYPDPPEPRHSTHKDSFYVKIALVLAAFTALEVSTYYIDFGAVFLPLLLTLMSIKFFMVAWFFMHLRDDSKIFGRLFWTGLILALVVYVVALSTFQFFRA